MSGMVYFIVTVGDPAPRCKIGYTQGEPDARLKALQTGSPWPLAVYTAIDGTPATERVFHETFAPLRLHGEWFAIKGKLLDFLICLMDDAETRRPADWVNVLTAIEIAVLADAPHRDDDDPEEYAASADLKHWQWMADIRALDAV